MRRLSMVAGVLLALGACGQDPPRVTPRTFERPGNLAFVCLDIAARQFVPLRPFCEGLPGEETDPYALVALVTQTASGEVGAIDFRLGRVVDADGRVPGFTFTRVGEFPSAIAVSPNGAGRVTYIASFGSRAIEYYPTADFLGGAAVSAGFANGSVPLPGAPTDLVIAPDGSTAYAAIPSMGLVVPVPIQPDGTLAAAGGEAMVSTPTESPMPVAGSETEYVFACGEGFEVGQPDPTAVRIEAVEHGPSPRPHRMIVAGDQLLVADEALPLIHRFAIAEGGALTELEPLAPGVPVRDLAVSPVVPAVPGGPADDLRYLYAIDDTDQSVLVMDFSLDETGPSFGTVLPVRFGPGDSDRLRLTGRATSLDVITRGYDPADPTHCAVATGAEGPINLRGVFLAVGLATGFVQLVDVVDLDGPCRGVECGGTGEPLDQIVAIQRHRPRIGQFVSDPLETLGSPILTVDGVVRLGQDPTEEDPFESIDGLLPPPVCPEGQTLVYSDLVCATADPWALRQERWTATYEGTIPGTTDLAKFARDDAGQPLVTTIELAGTADYLCRRGVLGQQDVAASGLSEIDPERDYVGDTLVITTEPDESFRDTACDRFFEPTDGTEREELSFQILAAFDDRMELVPEGDFGSLLECYPSFFGFEIRLTNAYLVSGTQTGFLHRVVENAEGACRIDVAAQPIDVSDPRTFVNGRAFSRSIVDDDMDPETPPVIGEARPYANPFIAFTLDAIPVTETAVLEFSLTGVPELFRVRVGARPGRDPVVTIVDEVVYSAVDERLYVIDSNASSLVQYEVGEFQLDTIFE